MDDTKKTFLIESTFFLLLLIICGSGVGSIFGSGINLIDEGQFGSWAYQVQQGKKLFVDIYSTYGPLYTYPLYHIFTIFGPDAFFVRLYLLFGSFLGGIAVLYIAYNLKLRQSLRLFLLVCLSFLPIITLRQGIGLLSLGLFVKGQKTGNKEYLFFSGVCLSYSFLISSEVAIFSASTIFFMFLCSLFSGSHFKDKLGVFIFFILGILVVFLPFVITSYHNNWLFSYIEITGDVFISFSGSNVPNGMNFPSLSQILLENDSLIGFGKSLVSQHALVYWIACGYLFTFCYLFVKFFKGFKREDTWIASLCIFGVLLYSVVLSRPGIGHVYFILSPLLLILLYFFQILIPFIHSKVKEERILSLFIISIILFFLMRLFMIYRYEIIKSGVDVLTYPERSSSSNISFLHLNSVQESHITTSVHIINTYTNPSDTIFYFSDNPMMYLLSKRVNATSYDLPYIANSKQKRYQIVSELSLRRPKIILYDNTSWDIDGISNKQRLPEVYEYIKNNYSLITSDSKIDVYKLNK